MTIILTAACSSSSYPGVDYEFDGTGEASNDEAQRNIDLGLPIHVYVRNQSFISKGMGPFDMVNDPADRPSTNRYQRSLFRLFAFRDRPDLQGPLMGIPNLTERSGNVNDAKANCLIDGTTFELGMPARLKLSNGEFVMKVPNLSRDTVLRYSTRFTDIGYNFFAYHLDDAQVVATHRASDSISYDLEIDGTQDLMVGHSPRLDAQLLAKDYGSVELTQDQRNKILNIGNYSSYSGYFGVDPYIPMRHVLTRLRFKAYPGKQEGHDVFIDTIKVLARSQVRLTVAHGIPEQIGASFTGERKWHLLKGTDPTTQNDPNIVGTYPYKDLNPANGVVVWRDEEKDLDIYDRTPTIIGGDIMVPTDSVYQVYMAFHQTVKKVDGSTFTKHDHQTFTLKANQINESVVDFNDVDNSYWYRPGWFYVIRIGVYGLEKVTSSVVTAEGWEEGGDLVIDEEW